jgi:hypothetical protein
MTNNCSNIPPYSETYLQGKLYVAYLIVFFFHAHRFFKMHVLNLKWPFYAHVRDLFTCTRTAMIIAISLSFLFRFKESVLDHYSILL